MEWTSVDDALPEPFINVLICHGKRGGIIIAHFDRSEWIASHIEDMGPQSLDEWPHWCHLPLPAGMNVDD